MSDACGTTQPVLSRRRILQLTCAGAGGLTLAAAGLAPRGDLAARSALATPTAGEDAVEPWDYESGTGPEEWGQLHPDYATCSRGENQSPINIDASTGEALTNIEFGYQTVSPLPIINNGNTILVLIPHGNEIEFERRRYELQQFHFHSPSEHTVDGETYAMELHLVHLADDLTIAVVSVLLAEGAEHATLQPVFDGMPGQPGDPAQVDVPLDLLALLPEQRTTYRYEGSLTTPPCSEGVQWFLFTEPAEVSAEQVDAFRKVIGENARPAQPLNDRPVEEDSSP